MGAPLGHVVVLAFPQLDILVQEISAAKQIDPISLIGQAQSQVEHLEREQHLTNFTTPVLGEDRTVEVYRGTMEQRSQSVRVKIYLVEFEHEDDSIVAVGILPRDAGDHQDVHDALQAVQEA
jgi:hypothetical protein